MDSTWAAGSGLRVRTQFAVITHWRSGSTMLIRGLGEHSGVQAHGEIFHKDPDQRPAATGGMLVYQEPESGGTFLERLFQLGRCRWAPTCGCDAWCFPRCSGFKIFYDQAEAHGAESAWRWLEYKTNVHIIHLVRANLLESWVSFQVASRTNEWVREHHQGEANPPPPFEIDALRCERFFYWVVKQRLSTRSRFVHHPWIEIEYQRDLVSHWRTTMSRLQDFLGLTHESIQPVTVRQQARPVREQVTNYSALARRWAGSPWAAFFEDEHEPQ